VSTTQRSPLDFLQLIRQFGPASRADLARLAGVAISTASLHVEELLASGLVEDAGVGQSQGGRRPRLLRVRSGGDVVFVVELGSQHARLGIMDIAGHLNAAQTLPIVLDKGPESVLASVSAQLERLRAEQGGPEVRGVGMAIPGPVEPASGRIISPSRMPGWASFPVASWMAGHFDVPSIADNDANLLTLGEYRSRWAGSEVRHVVGVKVGRGIGCGIVSNGALHYGGRGAAGDISHVRASAVGADGAQPCGCGNVGCLETLASGAALLSQMATADQPVGSLAELVQRAVRGDPLTNTLLRQAGSRLGDVLAVVVNFFNPQVLLIGGALAGAESLVAAVRAAIYERCMPLANESLEITTVSSGADAGLLGAGSLILDHLIEVARQ
jgi:predicted NBD/HSP70 family sugar kinase